MRARGVEWELTLRYKQLVGILKTCSECVVASTNIWKSLTKINKSNTSGKFVGARISRALSLQHTAHESTSEKYRIQKLSPRCEKFTIQSQHLFDFELLNYESSSTSSITEIFSPKIPIDQAISPLNDFSISDIQHKYPSDHRPMKSMRKKLECWKGDDWVEQIKKLKNLSTVFFSGSIPMLHHDSRSVSTRRPEERKRERFDLSDASERKKR